ncbi:hypothetical protein SAMN05880558_103434 [Aeromonas sp. RU39B]|jgi:hypothetical protein|uniref:hypothetical protein n=1 Tax=Aeromonas sp. RU39B TaxID=1907416 RepID=UPI000954DABB|nr:hypothetical protein [Aeromonas sp. RU39B]SIQ50059.1 hypothetical protein SAMN05880558_103434 [Aeromonas sp. RU39B]
MRIGMLLGLALLAGCSPTTDREADLNRLVEICLQQKLPATMAREGEASSVDPQKLADEQQQIEARFADEDNRAWLETQHRDDDAEQTCIEETLERLEK